jgi:hypothetical protein
VTRVLAAVMERGAERFFTATTLGPPGKDESPTDYLRRMFGQSGDAIVERPDFLRLFVILRMTNDEPAIAPIVERVRTRGRAVLHQTIAHAFRHAGSDRATALADERADLALATFDGAFVALQASPGR